MYLQELPHRIGDYAVFVNAGMTPFQVSEPRIARIWNILNSGTLIELYCVIGDNLQYNFNFNCLSWMFDGLTFTRLWSYQRRIHLWNRYVLIYFKVSCTFKPNNVWLSNLSTLYLGTGVFLYVAVGALTPELKEAEEISVEKGLSRQVNIQRRLVVLIVHLLKNNFRWFLAFKILAFLLVSWLWHAFQNSPTRCSPTMDVAKPKIILAQMIPTVQSYLK